MIRSKSTGPTCLGKADRRFISRPFAVIAVLMVAVAITIRIHNGLTFLPFRSYDGFGHFTYIWYMAETWRVPLSTSGWSFFHATSPFKLWQAGER